MATLFTYLHQVQRFLRDEKQEMLNPDDLRLYINRARREVAMRAQCIRVLPNISGSVVSWTVTNGGSGYSNNPTLAITPPDFPSGQPGSPNGRQAVAAAIIRNGVIISIDSTDGGAGYFQPIMTITDSTGVNATATAVMSPMNLLKVGQERYDFSDVDLSAFPGIGEIYFVRSVAIIYANYRYVLPKYAFTIYQAYVRQYPFQYQYVPTMCSQFGQGAGGSMYFFPIPSQTYQMEWDALALPSDLLDDQSYDALPDPWTDAVPYFAAALCYEELQSLNNARYYHDQFEKRLLNYSNYARIGTMINPYGRAVVPFMLAASLAGEIIHLLGAVVS